MPHTKKLQTPNQAQNLLYGVYFVFIVSIGLYFYWSSQMGLQLFLAAQDDTRIHIFLGLLALCWFGSVFVITQRFRFYLQQQFTLRALMAAGFPATVVPSVWLLLQLFKVL